MPCTANRPYGQSDFNPEYDPNYDVESRVKVDNDKRHIPMPRYIFVSPQWFFPRIFGRECGRGLQYKTRGTYTCQNPLSFNITDQEGSAYKVEVKCKNPAHCREEWTSAPGHNKSFDINPQIAVAGRLSGLKHEQCSAFLSAVGTSYACRRSYYGYVERIDETLIAMALESKLTAALALRKELGVSNDAQLNITISFDGTWLSKGFKSKFGAVTIVAAKTGKIQDVVFLSTYCSICDTKTVDENDNHVCQTNHVGSAGSMEVTGAVEAFSRSISLFGFCYTQVARDGDSRSYEAVKDIYPGVTVQSLADKNHVAKNFFKKLNKVRGGTTDDGESLKGRGRITQQFALQVANYMGKAIRDTARKGGTAAELTNAFWRVFFHKSQRHQNVCKWRINQSINQLIDACLCPKGRDSWCMYQVLLVDGLECEYEQKNFVSKEVMEAVRPVFEEATKPENLVKLLHDESACLNEAFHSLIWSYCPKANCATIRSVRIAGNLALCVWNDGLLQTAKVLYEKMVLKFPETLLKATDKRDNHRTEQREERSAAKNEKKPTESAESPKRETPPKSTDTAGRHKRRKVAAKDYEPGGHEY